MLISLGWIKDFVAVPALDAKALGVKFTMATAEVEEVHESGDYLEKVKVAQIKKIEPHPEADKLNLVSFDDGTGNEKRVVCGASNVKIGLKVPYAPIGVKLPNGLELTPKKIRGVLSEGMLCSAEELGKESTIDGLLELPADARLGQTMGEFFQESGDIVLNIDNKSLTHRPDLWGHYGVAREFATIFSQPLKNPYDQKWQENLQKKISGGSSPITPELKGESAGHVYLGLSVDGVSVGQAPAWMRQRLESAGLRSINSLVDVSNYVMLELGIPNHLFDRKKVSGSKLIIEKLQEAQKFKTLDGIERELVAGDTIIRDDKQTQVLAGIMGGELSSVDESTTSLFIEVANWHPAMVRKTSTRLGLRTDSSQRYEKSLDSRLCERTLYRLLELILELNPTAKVVGKLEWAGAKDLPEYPLELETSQHSICRQLGKEVEQKQIVALFESLGFKTQASDGGRESKIKVQVPSYRATKDVECEADLVEEIGRMIGYDNIVPTSPLLAVSPVRLSSSQLLHRKIGDFMVYRARAFEIMTYPLVGKEYYQDASWPYSPALELINALSVEHSVMRDSLVPGLLRAADLNRKHSDHFQAFELGRTYLPDEKNFAREAFGLGFLRFEKQAKTSDVFLQTCNTMEALAGHLGINLEFCEKNEKFENPLMPKSWIGIHPYAYKDLKLMGKLAGVVTMVHPLVLRNYKIKGELCLALLDLSSFHERELKSKIKYEPLSKFPKAQFDCTVLADKSISLDFLVNSASKQKLAFLQNVRIVDLFSQADGRLAVTLRATFHNKEGTLSHEELKSAESSFVSGLNKSGFPLKV